MGKGQSYPSSPLAKLDGVRSVVGTAFARPGRPITTIAPARLLDLRYRLIRHLRRGTVVLFHFGTCEVVGGRGSTLRKVVFCFLRTPSRDLDLYRNSHLSTPCVQSSWKAPVPSLRNHAGATIQNPDRRHRASAATGRRTTKGLGPLFFGWGDKTPKVSFVATAHVGLASPRPRARQAQQSPRRQSRQCHSLLRESCLPKNGDRSPVEHEGRFNDAKKMHLIRRAS